jgi:cytochrome b561
MMRNSATAWGWPAKALHWIGAALILVLLVHGWWMTHLTPRPDRLANYAWHSALGFDVLALIVLRMLWRWANPVPTQPTDSKSWERLAAQAGHVGLYVLMLAVSLTGWAVANTVRVPITQDLLGISLPLIVGPVERATRALIEDTHMVLAYVLAGLVVVHIAGALRHHFWKKNDVLRRML